MKPFKELRKLHQKLREPIIHGLIRSGETANIIAPPKVGKSWLLYGLLLSVATGRRWLGIHRCVPGNVLLLDNELHPETLAQRIPAVADAMGIRAEEYEDRLYIEALRGSVRGIDKMGEFFDAIEPGQFDVIAIDAWYRMLPEGVNENDNTGIRDAFNTLDRIAARLGCAFVLIHHSSKGQQHDKAVTDVGAGAGAQSRAADTHLILRPHEDADLIVLEGVTRSWAPIEPVVLRWTFPVWTAEAEADPKALKRPKGKGEEAQAERDRQGRESILTALRESNWQTRKRLRESTGLSNDRCNKCVRQLVDAGEVTIEVEPDDKKETEYVVRSVSNRPTDRPADQSPEGGRCGPPKGGDRPTSHPSVTQAPTSLPHNRLTDHRPTDPEPIPF